MSWMSSNISMDTSTRGGIGKGISRALSGESLFMVEYEAKGKGAITFASEFPGNIVVRELDENEKLICQKDAFMVAESSVNLDMKFRKKLGAGFFGGEGFIMQEVTGPGYVFFELAGEVVEHELKEDQILKVDPGHLGIFEPEVDYDITRVEGFTNMLFGGEGIFLARMEGPGKIWLQSMPLQNLASKMTSYLTA